MPELPDLVYLKKKLTHHLIGKKIEEVNITNPIVLRILTQTDFIPALKEQTFNKITCQGPFLIVRLDQYELVIHFMLTGRFHYHSKAIKPLKSTCFSLLLTDHSQLSYSDQKQMGKIYLTEPTSYAKIPGFMEQGMDILTDSFTLDWFKQRLHKKRCQVRVLIMDQTILSAIGNAYADEILFRAKIHPKTLCHKLTAEQIEQLYHSIKQTIKWGIEEVEKADLPIDKKVRDHMQVRNRKNQPCPICQTKIRRETVYGYDTFFCPGCQPVLDSSFIPWK